MIGFFQKWVCHTPMRSRMPRGPRLSGSTLTPMAGLFFKVFPSRFQCEHTFYRAACQHEDGRMRPQVLVL